MRKIEKVPINTDNLLNSHMWNIKIEITFLVKRTILLFVRCQVIKLKERKIVEFKGQKSVKGINFKFGGLLMARFDVDFEGRLHLLLPERFLIEDRAQEDQNPSSIPSKSFQKTLTSSTNAEHSKFPLNPTKTS